MPKRGDTWERFPNLERPNADASFMERALENLAREFFAELERRARAAQGASSSSTNGPKNAPRARRFDAHAALGIPIDADQETIRKAYLELVKKHHPDRHENAPAPERRRHEKRMREINAAYEELRKR